VAVVVGLTRLAAVLAVMVVAVQVVGMTFLPEVVEP
jgi:hypothetical protein